MTKNILLAVPTYNGEIRIELVSFLQEAAPHAILYPILHKPTDVARNLAASMAQTMGCHLLMVDADAVPAKGTFNALRDKIAQEVCVAAVPYVAAGGQICVGEQSPRLEEVEHLEGWHEVDNFGTHCCLIHREVFERLDKPYFQYAYNDDHTFGTSEDIVFGRKVKAAGIPIYVNYSFWGEHKCVQTKSKPRSLSQVEKILLAAGLGL